jgi:hypothetical protein
LLALVQGDKPGPGGDDGTGASVIR